MTPQEMIACCDKQIALQKKVMGKDASEVEVGFVVKGRMGSKKKRLCPGGPLGKPVSDLGAGVYCFFNAIEVKEFVLKMIRN